MIIQLISLLFFIAVLFAIGFFILKNVRSKKNFTPCGDKKVIINNTIKIDKMIGLEKGILSKKSIIF